ncbi:MAG: GlxA family transcriptional regulator [Paracoccus sp. (in: a-proteobacteria)]|uniref:GlxA family transcriptional regulator n=1 Tax=Paracoccus sp. TaxID=267 RepID=UPI0026E0976B|nr:GlxA family transcriptional regulator [Paracoccus sp. (in: a-proteobacteria)]MDO5631601.1 GlxA family transcriptional regulator [Paracoccus sp. (in: a-proteobacteria)]
MRMSPISPFHLTFLLFDGFSNMVLASVIEPLRAARDLSGRRVFSWQTATLDGTQAHSSSGLAIGVDLPLDRIGATDALVVVAGYGVRDQMRREVLQAVLTKARGLPMIVGLDTGAWLLAGTGLLTGRRAAVHWMEREALAEAFPEIEVVDAPFVTCGNIVTCGGARDVLEWSLDLIGRRTDEALRYDVATMFGGIVASVTQRPDQMTNRALPPAMQRAVQAMRQTTEAPVPLIRIAEAAAVSERTLDRLFHAHLGMAAGRYYRLIRLTHAHALARETTLTLAEIAVRTGFASASTLARAYRAHFGHSLGQSRQN